MARRKISDKTAFWNSVPDTILNSDLSARAIRILHECDFKDWLQIKAYYDEHGSFESLPSCGRKTSNDIIGELHRLTYVEKKITPVDMIMNCPVCHARHIDEGEFASKPHKTHACQSCGHLWRPSHSYTRGVQFLEGCEPAPKPFSFDYPAGIPWRPGGAVVTCPVAQRTYVEMKCPKCGDGTVDIEFHGAERVTGCECDNEACTESFTLELRHDEQESSA